MSCTSAKKRRITDWIKFNVGGRVFQTTRATLLSRDLESVFASMFGVEELEENKVETATMADPQPLWTSTTDATGAFLIDRSSRYFEIILDYLRYGKIICDHGTTLEGVLEEAKFYGLAGLEAIVKEKLVHGSFAGHCSGDNDSPPLRRSDVVRILLQTPYNMANQLRFQGVNLSGSDLSYLDLRNINFKFADLSVTNLTGANLSDSVLERANLAGAVLDEAQLLAVKMARANMEGCSLRNCNFEDPHQRPANLEGGTIAQQLFNSAELPVVRICDTINSDIRAILKSSVLEGSQMCGVILRVASLKNANLRNCALRSAVLAGADLENCDFSGCDLHEANLRGANFTNALFNGLKTPIHVTQMHIIYGDHPQPTANFI